MSALIINNKYENSTAVAVNLEAEVTEVPTVPYKIHIYRGEQSHIIDTYL